MDKRSIIFIDRDKKVLDGLQRVFRPMRQFWNMHFENSPQQAFEVFHNEPVDMVLTEITSDEGDGIEFLDTISREFPEVVRIIFASDISQTKVKQALNNSHQIILKPIDAESLKSRIMRIFTLRELLGGKELKKLVGQMRSIPSLPYFYREIMAEIKKPDASLKRVGEIITQDMAMSAKILQLVNSPYFGFYKHVSDPVQAVLLLGLDLVRDMTLTLHLFSCFQDDAKGVISYPQLWEHCMQTGSLAKLICRMETDDEEQANQAFIAGLLHDVGKLILAVDFPELYHGFMQTAREKDIAVIDLERQTFRATHAELAAYLLSIWGLPDPIVEAVAFHHRPSSANLLNFAPLVAVHAANWIRNRNEESFVGALSPIDMRLLKSLNLQKRLPKWQALCN